MEHEFIWIAILHYELLCSMNYSVCSIQCTSTASWILWQKVICEMVYLHLYSFMYFPISLQYNVYFFIDFAYSFTITIFNCYSMLLCGTCSSDFFPNFPWRSWTYAFEGLAEIGRHSFSLTFGGCLISYLCLPRFCFAGKLKNLKYWLSFHCCLISFQEMELARSLRQNKVKIKICQVPFFFIFKIYVIKFCCSVVWWGLGNFDQLSSIKLFAYAHMMTYRDMYMA